MLTHSESLTVCIIILFHLYNYYYYRYYYYFRWLVQYPFKYVIWTLANVLRSVAKTPSVSTANISTVHTHNKIYNSVYNISHKGQLLVCVAVKRTRYTLCAVLDIDHCTKIKKSLGVKKFRQIGFYWAHLNTSWTTVYSNIGLLI